MDIKKFELEGLSYNTERFRTLKFGVFNFVDSIAFMDSSLDKIVEDLVTGDHDFSILKKSGLLGDGVGEGGELVGEEARLRYGLLKKKGVFPYEALRSSEEFAKMDQIPPKAAFYSTLSGLPVSDDDYQRAKDVFRAFNCKSMLDYLMLYNVSGERVARHSYACTYSPTFYFRCHTTG